MPSPLEVRDWHELDVVSSDGQSVGKLIDVYVNNESGEPEFLLVASGFLHNRLHLAPAGGVGKVVEKYVGGVGAVVHPTGSGADKFSRRVEMRGSTYRMGRGRSLCRIAGLRPHRAEAGRQGRAAYRPEADRDLRRHPAPLPRRQGRRGEDRRPLRQTGTRARRQEAGSHAASDPEDAGRQAVGQDHRHRRAGACRRRLWCAVLAAGVAPPAVDRPRDRSRERCRRPSSATTPPWRG